MPAPRDIPSRADRDRAIDDAERMILWLLSLADEQAVAGRFDLARETRMRVLVRQEELNCLRGDGPAPRN